MSYRALTRLRRLSQLVFFALFLFLPARRFLQADPLVAVTAALSTRALYKGLIWSLAVILPTFFLGRFVCGWVCPLGSLNHFIGSWKSEKKRGARRIESNRYQGWQRLKYYILIAALTAALLGSSLAGLLDPISLAARGLALSTLPSLSYSLNALLLIAILALNLRVTRFWCRALCPLGALLGWMSRWSILSLEKHPNHCEDCNRCLLHCQGGDDPIPGAKWRKAECHLCLNCVDDCPEGGLRFRFFPAGRNTVEGPNLERRKAIAGLAAGVVALPLLSATREQPIRPPGALDEKEFLKRCIRCGECMRVCPNQALHPAGLAGIWTPVLVPRIGYCELSCTLCGQNCPSGAIWEFTLAQKGWDRPSAGSKPIRIGTAFYDRGRCLPWSMATDCIVCEEWCPMSPKAVYLRPAEVTDSAGVVKTVRQPYVDPERCVGCGACEYACPVKERPAVYVTSVGESRSRSNQLLLGGRPKPAASPFPNQVPGWSKSSGTRTFEADDLWRYVDGGAEKYIQAGVVRALTAGYRYRDKTDAVADVYVMKSAEGARSVFESEPAEGSRPVALGEAARLYTGSLTFRQRACFVRVVAMGDCPPEALVALARGIAIPSVK